MTEKIEPALTAAEWSGADNTVLSTTSPKLGYFVYAECVAEGLELCVVGPSKFTLTLPADDRHKLAALALHGQPYGFTLEDAKDIVAAAGLLNSPFPDFCARLRTLAARIEALLPPESV